MIHSEKVHVVKNAILSLVHNKKTASHRFTDVKTVSVATNKCMIAILRQVALLFQ